MFHNTTNSNVTTSSPHSELIKKSDNQEKKQKQNYNENSIVKFYWMNGYLLLVEYLLYLEDVEEEEELLMNMHESASHSSHKDGKKHNAHQSASASPEKAMVSSFETIEDILMRVDLKEKRKHVPKFIEAFENNCIDFGFELFGHFTQKDSKRIDPMSALFCRNPTKEAFLLFTQERIHSTLSETSQFSKRIDLDSARELRNKFIEKTFLKVTTSTAESRAQFPSELKTREKKTEFLLNICNSFIEGRHNEHLEPYFQKFFGGYVSSRNNTFANERLGTVALVHDTPTNSSISNTSIQRDINIAKRLVSACIRNIMILYFIQNIFSSSRIETEEDESIPSTNNFYKSKDYRVVIRQMLLVISLIDINVALRDMVKETLQQEVQHHRSTVQQPLEKTLHQLVHEKLLSSYTYLNSQVKRQMELHGYGSKGVDILTRDVLFWIFKIFNALKVMDKNEKEKIKQEQDKITNEEFIEEPKDWAHSDTFKLNIVQKIMTDISEATEDRKSNVVDAIYSDPTTHWRNFVHLYPCQELEEEFPLDDIISQCSHLMHVQSKTSHL
ncbi:hypothetical protein C9374_002212 [Naegleria lovaniensis]|uniref:Uncharacterized protein n=1 Tax=Naegleria lovaniensis TaxID=51637 RepID=A0AA88KL81_NAELO|nr:uncharacterized protein C9374_002212 [Naegleria lovaniensis]KAG2386468.1 hypothetical protein C9374_002212 [Naegleria lovaniensis]